MVTYVSEGRQTEPQKSNFQPHHLPLIQILTFLMLAYLLIYLLTYLLPYSLMYYLLA